MSDLQAVRRAAKNRERANTAFRDTIKAAHANGHSLRKIADAAGISNPRVLQIVRDQ